MQIDVEERESRIDQLCAITATDTSSGRRRNEELLTDCEWSVERAVDRFYAKPWLQGDASLDDQPAASSSSSRAPPSTSSRTSGESPPARSAEAYGKANRGTPYAARIGLSTVYALFVPVRWIVRILAGVWFLLVRNIIPTSFLAYIPRVLLPPSLSRPSNSFPLAPIIPSFSHEFTLPATSPLPSLHSGPYKAFLTTLRTDARLGMLIVTSEVHENHDEFVSAILAGHGDGAEELGKMLKDEDVVVWGCDVGDREGWQVAKTLQLTTFPSIIFFSLLPASTNPAQSSSSSSPRLQILTTLSGPPSTTTSPSAILQLLSTSIVPRTKPFLSRIKRERRQQAEARWMREEQDRALRESERRDTERILAGRREREEKARLEREEVERKARLETHAIRRKETIERYREERTIWRKWARANLLGAEPPVDDVKAGQAIRVQLRMPQGTPAGSGGPGRYVRIFPKSSDDVAGLFVWAETLLLPALAPTQEDRDLSEEEQARLTDMLDSDPAWASSEIAGSGPSTSSTEAADLGIKPVKIRLFTTYPRKEVDVYGGEEAWGLVVKGGGSLAMEIEGDVGSSAARAGDEGAESSEDEEEVDDDGDASD